MLQPRQMSSHYVSLRLDGIPVRMKDIGTEKTCQDDVLSEPAIRIIASVSTSGFVDRRPITT